MLSGVVRQELRVRIYIGSENRFPEDNARGDGADACVQQREKHVAFKVFNFIITHVVHKPIGRPCDFGQTVIGLKRKRGNCSTSEGLSARGAQCERGSVCSKTSWE